MSQRGAHKSNKIMRGVIFGGLTFLFLAAYLLPQASFHPIGNIESIKNVTVSKPADSEMNSLLTISKLPAENCYQDGSKKTCTIDPEQAIKWGWGFCENDKKTLAYKTANTQIELVVDNVRLPEEVIFERDETYDRNENSYCHTWFTKLSNWQQKQTIRLENKAVILGLPTANNVFVMHVK